MARYIDADALMKEFTDFVRPSNMSDFEPIPTWNDAVSLVGSAPTADVRENVRGEWIYGEEGCYGNPYGHYSCSNCNEQMPWRFDFCPNCGCSMKGEYDERS